jgi:hypothetical protein
VFLADKPLFGDVADEFLAFVGDAPLVAHNASFDIAFHNDAGRGGERSRGILGSTPDLGGVAGYRGHRVQRLPQPSAFFTRSAVIGVSRSLTPVRRATALPIAGATTVTGIWPTPDGYSSLAINST